MRVLHYPAEKRPAFLAARLRRQPTFLTPIERRQVGYWTEHRAERPVRLAPPGLAVGRNGRWRPKPALRRPPRIAADANRRAGRVSYRNQRHLFNRIKQPFACDPRRLRARHPRGPSSTHPTDARGEAVRAGEPR